MIRGNANSKGGIAPVNCFPPDSYIPKIMQVLPIVNLLSKFYDHEKIKEATNLKIGFDNSRI